MKNIYGQYLKPYLEDDTVILCGIFLLALLLRLVFIPHLMYDPAFIHPVVDCKEHNILAVKILDENQWRINEFWYHTPGYAYFLAVVYKLLGHSVVRLAVVQSVLGAACACLVYIMIKRLINRWAALFGATLMSVYWMLIYTQLHVYSENLSMFFNMFLIWVLLFWRDTWRKYLLAGLLLGISIVVRPEMLPFVGVFIFWLFIKRFPLKKVVLYYLLFVLGVALCIIPLMFRNYQLSGNFAIREQIGVNFYMGSMPKHKGSNIYVTIGQEWIDIVGMPYFEQNIYDRTLPEKEVTAFFVKKVVEYVKQHPIEWISFMAGKIFSVAVGIDFLRAEDVYFYERYIHSTPLVLLQTWFICVLALVGLGYSLLKEPRKFAVLYLFLGSYIFALLFTYKTRYLVSHVPLIIIFTSYAFAVLIEAIRANNIKQVSIMVGVVLALCAGVKWNPLRIVWPSQSEMYYAIGVNFDYFEDFKLAEENFQKAIDIDPKNVSAWKELGMVYMKTGDYLRAANTLKHALELLNTPRISTLYDQALEYYQYGGKYNVRDFYPPSFSDHIDRYHYYFPYPYQGPIYQKRHD